MVFVKWVTLLQLFSYSRIWRRKSFCKPDIVSYNTLIDSLCKDGQFVDAFDLFSEMIRNGIMPNGIIYTILAMVTLDLKLGLRP